MKPFYNNTVVSTLLRWYGILIVYDTGTVIKKHDRPIRIRAKQRRRGKQFKILFRRKFRNQFHDSSSHVDLKTDLRWRSQKIHSFPKRLVDETHREFHRERNIGIDIEFLPLWITFNARVNFLLLDLARDGISDQREISATVCNVLINFHVIYPSRRDLGRYHSSANSDPEFVISRHLFNRSSLASNTPRNRSSDTLERFNDIGM